MTFTPIRACLRRPTAAGLEAEFTVYNTTGRFPCTRSNSAGGRRVVNQCAVRMSLALCRSMGHDILGSYPPRTGNLHSDRCCANRSATDPQNYRHSTRAVELRDYLANTLGFRFEVIGSDPAVISAPNERKGIIFFLNLDGGTGSHIDYWNGSSYTNEYSGSNAPNSNLPMFRDAQRVELCELY